MLQINPMGDAVGKEPGRREVVHGACVEINQCVGCTPILIQLSHRRRDAADLARPSGE